MIPDRTDRPLDARGPVVRATTYGLPSETFVRIVDEIRYRSDGRIDGVQRSILLRAAIYHVSVPVTIKGLP